LIEHREHNFVARQISGTQAVFGTSRHLSLVRTVGVHLPDLPFVAASLLSGEKDPGGVEINLRVGGGEELWHAVFSNGMVRLRMEAYDLATFGEALGPTAFRESGCLHEDNVRPRGIRCGRGGRWLGIRSKSAGADAQENGRGNSNVNKELWLVRLHNWQPSTA
jgi:hypothetical protein